MTFKALQESMRAIERATTSEDLYLLVSLKTGEAVVRTSERDGLASLISPALRRLAFAVDARTGVFL